jgi:hypothetical protein
MKCFTILLDDKAHTALFFVKADTKIEALEVFTLHQVAGCEKRKEGWLIRDFKESKYDKIFGNIEELVDKYWKTTSQRFEIQEIEFDPDKKVQEIFCSLEKSI